MELWPLPDAWEWKRLGSVASDTERRNPSAKPDDYFRYVDIASVDNEKGEIKIGDVQSILGRNAPSRARKVIKEHDTIFATTRPYLRNVAIVPKELNDQICSTGFCVIRARSGTSLPGFLYYACRSSFFIEQLLPRQRGATYPAVTDAEVYDAMLPIPYPDDPTRSLETQRRIVARIEALFAELQECRKLHDEIAADTGRVMEAALAEAFTGLSSERLSLGDILESPPRNGWSPNCDGNPNGTPVLRLGAVLGFEYDPTEIKFTSQSTDAAAHYWAQPDDVFISRSNTPDLVGHAAMYVGAPHPCIYPDLLMKLRVRRTQADPRFVVYWLRGQEVRGYIRSKARGASSTMKKINQQDVMLIPFPSIELSTQHMLVEYFDALKAQVLDMKQIESEDTVLLERLEQSILAQAFRGEL